MKRSLIPKKLLKKGSSLAAGKSSLLQDSTIPVGASIILGVSRHTNEPAVLNPKDRKNHTHVIGSTGTGKSKFLELMLRQDVENEKCGVCLIDPHGKLYHDILAYVAAEKPHLSERIITFNPFNDLENIVGFNPIPRDVSRIDYIEKTVIASCLKAWGQSNILDTPRIATWLQNIFHTLLVNDLTLLESGPLIDTEKWNSMRTRMLENIENDTVRNDWILFENGTLSERRQMIEGAGNRLKAFLQNEIIRLVIGQQKNVIDFEKIMEEGKILLVNMNDESGRVTSSDANLLGTMMVSELFRVTKQRDIYDPRLKPFYVYIDEFAQFVTQDIALGLEEARKFETFFILAHQHLAQLKREDSYLYASVLTNCKNKVVFGGLSEEDVDIMNKEINTGFVDLMSVKHEQTRIRERHIETVREVRSKSSSHTFGEAEQTSVTDTTGSTSSKGGSKGSSFSTSQNSSETNSLSQSETQGTARGSSMSSSETIGNSRSFGNVNGSSIFESGTKGQSHTHTEGQSHTTSRSQNQSSNVSETQGNSESVGTSQSESRGGSITRSQSHTEGQSSSETEGESISESKSLGNSDGVSRDGETYERQGIHEGESCSHGYTEGRQSTKTHGQSSSQTVSSGQSETFNQTRGKSHTIGTNSSNTSGRSLGSSSGSSKGRSFSDAIGHNSATTTGTTQNRSHSESEGQSSSHGETRGQSFSENEATMHGSSQAKTTGTIQGHSESQQHNFSQSESNSHSTGSSQTKNQSESAGETVSFVPFLEPHEVEEVASIEFWSREDLLYMKKAELKNQNLAEAFVKVGSNAPIHLQVANVPDVKISRHLKDDILRDLQHDIVSNNRDTYIPLRKAQELPKARQVEKLGGEIQYFDTLIPKEKTQRENSQSDQKRDGSEEVFGE